MQKLPRVFALYKPKGITSAQFLNKIKRILGVTKMGHAGTLDPLASGILVVGVGREGTKQLHAIVQHEKEYVATIRLGMRSTTDDEEGEKEVLETQNIPEINDIRKALKECTGTIMQIPPAYSALKIKGERAYALARAGKAPEMKPREVVISHIELLKYEWPYLSVRVVTGPGVYIRALARDIGEALGTGGYLADLERTRVGQFTLSSIHAISAENDQSADETGS